MRLTRRRREPMPSRFERLAVYNSEVDRGIVHTEEWRRSMARLQHDFDHWTRRRHAGLPWTPEPPYAETPGD